MGRKNPAIVQYTVRLSTLKGSAAVSLASWSQFAWQAVAVKPSNRELIEKTHKPITKNIDIYCWLTLKNGPTEPNLGGQGSAEDGVSGGGGQEKKPWFE